MGRRASRGEISPQPRLSIRLGVCGVAFFCVLGIQMEAVEEAFRAASGGLDRAAIAHQGPGREGDEIS